MRLLLLSLGGERSVSRKADGAPRGAVTHYKPISDPESVGTTQRQPSLGAVAAGANEKPDAGCRKRGDDDRERARRADREQSEVDVRAEGESPNESGDARVDARRTEMHGSILVCVGPKR